MLTTVSIGVIIAIFTGAMVRAYGWADIKQRIKKALSKLLT